MSRLPDPWAEVTAKRWDASTVDLHDREAHKRTAAAGWPACHRCSTLAIEFHDRHGIGHLVPADARHRYEQDARL